MNELMKNHWYIKGWCYWEKQLSTDIDGTKWINVGWHLPLLVQGDTLIKTLAVSGHEYARKFN